MAAIVYFVGVVATTIMTIIAQIGGVDDRYSIGACVMAAIAVIVQFVADGDVDERK